MSLTVPILFWATILKARVLELIKIHNTVTTYFSTDSCAARSTVYHSLLWDEGAPSNYKTNGMQLHFPRLLLATWEIFIFLADDGIIWGVGECVYPWGWGLRDNWLVAGRHVVSKQPVMFLKRLELTGACIPLSSWVRALGTPGRRKQHMLFLPNKSPILLSETFCSPKDTGPASQTFQLALLASHPFLLKSFTEIQKRKQPHNFFMFFLSLHSFQPHLDSFSFLLLHCLHILVFLSHPLLLKGSLFFCLFVFC